LSKSWAGVTYREENLGILFATSGFVSPIHRSLTPFISHCSVFLDHLIY
jgi:hypothetical protein